MLVPMMPVPMHRMHDVAMPVRVSRPMPVRMSRRVRVRVPVV